MAAAAGGGGGGHGYGSGCGGVPCGSGSGSGSRCCIPNPRILADTLNIIYGHYKAALAALPLVDMPALGPRLLETGVCFGFADPVTNIIANTAAYFLDCPATPRELLELLKKRKRRDTKTAAKARARVEVLSEIIVAGDAPTVAQRSLDGLLTFLTSYFRYLSTGDAARYLLLARADLLVAVRLIEDDHCYRREDRSKTINSRAVQSALKCAALSAGHPDIDTFLAGASSLASHLRAISKILPSKRLSVEQMYLLSGLLKRKKLLLKNLRDPIDLAAARLHHIDGGDACGKEGLAGLSGGDAGVKEGLAGMSDSLRGLLLDALHVQYLKAVSMMPMEEFRRRHCRGLLKAGYCFGHFNPVSNIIINTMWYDTIFPAQEEFEVKMMCTTHIESRSLDVLIKLVQAYIPAISLHDAMVYLLKSDLRLSNAVQMAAQEGRDTSGVSVSVYKGILDAAYHPQPDAHAELLARQILPMVLSDVNKLLQDCHTIPSSEVSRLLSPRNPPISSRPPDELTEDASKLISSYQKSFTTEQDFVCRKVKAALRNYEQTKGHQYELHLICGWNEDVGENIWTLSPKRPYSHSHVNFWASRKDGTSPTPCLFFAEFNNYEDVDEPRSFCCPVSDLSSRARCCHCECRRTRIVHPVGVSYCGGEADFELMACGKHTLTNPDIIGRGELMDSKLGIFKEDYLYLDPTRDAKFIQKVNHAAWLANLDWEAARARAEGMRAARQGLQQQQEDVVSHLIS